MIVTVRLHETKQKAWFQKGGLRIPRSYAVKPLLCCSDL